MKKLLLGIAFVLAIAFICTKVFEGYKLKNTSIEIAIATENTKDIRYLFRKKRKTRLIELFDIKALEYAIKKDKLNMIKFMLENGFDINMLSNYNETALMYAVSYNRLEIIKYLIEKGADINAKRKDGTTSLILASRDKKLNLVEYLVEKGANLELKNDKGDTALLVAISINNQELVKYLLENNSNVNSQNLLGETPLIMAVKRNNEILTDLLLKKGADISTKNNEGLDILTLAGRNKNLSIIKYLEEEIKIDLKKESKYFFDEFNPFNETKYKWSWSQKSEILIKFFPRRVLKIIRKNYMLDFYYQLSKEQRKTYFKYYIDLLLSIDFEWKLKKDKYTWKFLDKEIEKKSQDEYELSIFKFLKNTLEENKYKQLEWNIRKFLYRRGEFLTMQILFQIDKFLFENKDIEEIEELYRKFHLKISKKYNLFVLNWNTNNIKKSPLEKREKLTKLYKLRFPKLELINIKLRKKELEEILTLHKKVLLNYHKTKSSKQALKILENALIKEIIYKTPNKKEMKNYLNLINDYAYFLLQDENRLDDAQKVLSRVLSLDNKRAVAYLNLGNLFLKKFDEIKGVKYKKLARKNYEKYLKYITRKKVSSKVMKKFVELNKEKKGESQVKEEMFLRNTPEAVEEYEEKYKKERSLIYDENYKELELSNDYTPIFLERLNYNKKYFEFLKNIKIEKIFDEKILMKLSKKIYVRLEKHIKKIMILGNYDYDNSDVSFIKNFIAIDSIKFIRRIFEYYALELYNKINIKKRKEVLNYYIDFLLSIDFNWKIWKTKKWNYEWWKFQDENLEKYTSNKIEHLSEYDYYLKAFILKGIDNFKFSKRDELFVKKLFFRRGEFFNMIFLYYIDDFLANNRNKKEINEVYFKYHNVIVERYNNFAEKWNNGTSKEPRIKKLRLITQRYKQLYPKIDLMEKETEDIVNQEFLRYLKERYELALDVYQKTENAEESLKIMESGKIRRILYKKPNVLSNDEYLEILINYCSFLLKTEKLLKVELLLKRIINLKATRNETYLELANLYYRNQKKDKYMYHKKAKEYYEKYFNLSKDKYFDNDLIKRYISLCNLESEE